MTREKLKYFDYIELAEREYRELTKKYPELSELSKRELEVFSELLTDKTQVQIAKELFVSHSSIHFHCKNIYKKLGVKSRMQLLVKYKDI